jgi:hypothetical protein
LRVLAACVFGLLALCAPAMEAGAQTARAIELAPGLLIDQRGGAVFVMNAEGGIDALALRDGAQLWRSEAAAVPLAVAGGRLIAMSDDQRAENLLEIVSLDTRRGDVLARDAIELPEDVTASVDDTLEGRFDLDAIVRGGDAVIRWRFERDEISGAVETTEEAEIIEGEDGESRAGVVAFRLSTGELRNETRFAPLNLEEALAPQLSTRARADRRPGVEGALSADRRYIMTSEMIAEFGPERYLWTISNAANGAPLGVVRLDVSYMPYLVEDGLLILQGRPEIRAEGSEVVELPMRVRAFSLSTNAQVWAHEMRDTELRILPP